MSIINILKQSNRVLIVSHKSPDLDAILSTILTYKIIAKNFPKIELCANIEQLSKDSFYSDFEGFNLINNNSFISTIQNFNPDLIFMLDGTGYKMFTKENYEGLEILIKDLNIKTAIIDHHEVLECEKQDYDYYYNSNSSSCCEEVYRLLIQEEKLTTFLGLERLLLCGIYSDTYGFQYSTQKDTLLLVSSILKENEKLGRIKNRVIHYTPKMLELISEYLKNMNYSKKFNYSYITTEFYYNNVAKIMTEEEYKLGTRYFADEYLYSVGENKFGFLIAPSYSYNEKKQFKGSMRCLTDTLDCRVILYKMNGGGYKDGGGFRIERDNLDDALNEVIKIVEESVEEAKSALNK